MDFATILWLDSDYRHSFWEACYRRGCPEGFAGDDSHFYDVPADFDDNEDVGNDIGRRERLAKACYE